MSPAGIYLDVRKPPDAERLWMSPDEHIGKTLEDVLPDKLAAPRRFYFDLAVRTKEPQCYYYPHPYTPTRCMGCLITPTLLEECVQEVIVEVFDVVISRLPSHYVVK